MNEQDEIIYERAPVLFAIILRLLCGRANITQDYLEEAGKAYRDDLVAQGRLPAGYPTGSLDQSTIARVIICERLPTREQVRIWLGVLEDTFNSEKYAEIREKHELPKYSLPNDLKDDMYHLAGFGAPDDIVDSYKRRISMTVDPPMKRSTIYPWKQGRHSSKGPNNHHWDVAKPVNEV